MASPFSGKSGRNAAMWTAGYLQDLQPKILDQINQGKTEALGYEGQGLGAVNQGYGAALSQLGQFYGMGANQYNAASNALAPVQQQAMGGYGMLSNALGLNGPQGNAAATAAFQAGPGYQWQVDQATQAANRRAQSLGLLTSGNAQEATAQLSSNLANQEYQRWIGNLQPYQQQAGQIGQAQAQVLQNLGNLYGQEGQTTANLYGQQAGQLANIYGAQANTATNAAESGAQVMSGIGGQIANVGMQGMQAGQQAAQNRMSATMGGIQLGASLLGGMVAGPMGAAAGGALGGAGGGNFLSQLFK